MLRKGTFISKKINSIILFNLLTWFAFAVNMMVDAILGGKKLGETALSAVSIVSPLYSLIRFFAFIVIPGCGILYGLYIGEFKKDEAHRVAGTGLVAATIISTTISLLLLILKRPYLNYYGCTGELLEEASAYYNWYIAIAFSLPLTNVGYFYVVAEGDAFHLMLGSVGSIVSNIVLSYVLCLKLGISGLGMATFLSTVIELFFYSLHLFSKKNSIRFKLSLDFKILKKAFVLSVNTALNHIFVSIVDIIMNKVIIDLCGHMYVSAYSVVNLILNLFLISGGIVDSCRGIVTSYVGEKNNYGIRSVLKLAIKSLFIICGIMMIVLFFAAPYIPNIYGLSTPEVIKASIRATRILCVSAIPFGITYFAYNIYVCLKKPVLSIILAILYNFFCPLVLSIPLSFIFGFDGVSIGMSASSFVTIIIFVCYVRKRYGKQDFPWYLEETHEEAVSFDLNITKQSIVDIRDKVKIEFDKRGYCVPNLEVLIEEFYTRIYEKNDGKLICSECTLLFGEKQARIIIRDNGVIYNFVDENNPVESINSFVLNSLLETMPNRKYVITTSLNRNGFVFNR